MYESIYAKSLTREQRKEALQTINLIKEKRNGSLKGRTVADGRPQRGSLYDKSQQKASPMVSTDALTMPIMIGASLCEKSQTASPMVSTDALTLYIMIGAHEARYVATAANVPGAFLKAYMDDCEGGTKVLYVRLVKAIYDIRNLTPVYIWGYIVHFPCQTACSPPHTLPVVTSTLLMSAQHRPNVLINDIRHGFRSQENHMTSLYCPIRHSSRNL